MSDDYYTSPASWARYLVEENLNMLKHIDSKIKRRLPAVIRDVEKVSEDREERFQNKSGNRGVARSATVLDIIYRFGEDAMSS